MGVDAEMFVRVRRPLVERRIIRLGWELAGSLGAKKFWVDREQNRRPLYAIDVYEQDGPDIVPEPGEQFLRLALWGRYYGEGYERGDLPLYVAVADWLERRIPREPGVSSVEVWYGGDSSGACAFKFDRAARDKLLDHFAIHGHRPYSGYFDSGGTLKRHCSFCDEPMIRYMWGGHDLAAAFSCAGCGLDETSRDGGKTWAPTPKEERA